MISKKLTKLVTFIVINTCCISAFSYIYKTQIHIASETVVNDFELTEEHMRELGYDKVVRANLKAGNGLNQSNSLQPVKLVLLHQVNGQHKEIDLKLENELDFDKLPLFVHSGTFGDCRFTTHLGTGIYVAYRNAPTEHSVDRTNEPIVDRPLIVHKIDLTDALELALTRKIDETKNRQETEKDKLFLETLNSKLDILSNLSNSLKKNEGQILAAYDYEKQRIYIITPCENGTRQLYRIDAGVCLGYIAESEPV